MRVVIAPDKFKGRLTAAQAADAIERGMRSVLRDAEFVIAPMADGGEGTVEAFVRAGAKHGLDSRVVHVPLIVAADVDNPLCGPRGASRAYAAQKGANPAQIALLEDTLEHIADVAAAGLGRDERNTRGAGAAGGLGYALLQFFHAKMERARCAEPRFASRVKGRSTIKPFTARRSRVSWNLRKKNVSLSSLSPVSWNHTRNGNWKSAALPYAKPIPRCLNQRPANTLAV